MKIMHRFIAPIIIAVISFIVTHSGSAIYNLLRYDKQAILDGQVWRLLTGNLTHADSNHWLFNILGLGIIWYIYIHSRKHRELLLILTLATLGTTIGLLLFETQLKWYVGLSGALHGLLAAGIVLSIKQEPKYQLALVALLIIKLTYEQFSGPLPGFRELTVPVIVNSHLYGAVTGIVVGLGMLGYDIFKSKQKPDYHLDL